MHILFMKEMLNLTRKLTYEKIYNNDYHKADGAMPGYENAKPRETISYKNFEYKKVVYFFLKLVHML